MRRKLLTFAAILMFSVGVFGSASAQEPQFKDEFFKGEVIDILGEQQSEVIGDQQVTQQAQVRITSGAEKGEIKKIEHRLQSSAKETQGLVPGEPVVVLKNQEFDISTYYIMDKYRLPWLAVLMLAFFGLTIFFTGKRGVTALLGLGFNIFVIVSFIIPSIMSGSSPLLVCFGGGLVIAVVSLYCAHGFNKRSSIALASTLITLVIALILSIIFVKLTKLSGAGTEEAFFLQFGEYARVNLRGLLLGGIIIGALGVLDDVTTAQSAAVEELKRANPQLSFEELYKRGLSIGKEHITSLVNTLALAYAGASLPVLLIFTIIDRPFWVILNSEDVVEEMVRTLVGSSALILAVPIATVLAAHFFSTGKLSTSSAHRH
ncbi:MAG: YibE/F family protein [bacterium]|nr:YibE/F family protein [bacterium]